MTTNIAEIGFRANTTELDVADQKLNKLPASAGRAERSSQKLAAMFEQVNAASAKLMAAANGLSAAADKLSASTNRSTAANKNEAAATDAVTAAKKRKRKAVEEAAAGTRAETAASEAAAGAARKEAAAIDAVTAARRRARTSVPSVGGGSLGARSPWGSAAGNDNRPSGGTRGGVDGILAAQSTPSNIAAQFQDIGVTAAMGMNPLLIALQQGTQLSMAFAGGLGGVLSALKMMLGPTALITIALVGLVAAGLQMINWTKLAKVGLNAVADIMPILAHGAALVGAAIAIAFAPAILTAFYNTAIMVLAGVVSLIGGVVATFGAIPLAIGLIIADLVIFRDAWAQTLGVDLVGWAKTAINFIIGAFVGAYHDIQFLWNNFPDVIGAAAIGAANLVIRAVNGIIAATLAGINATIAAVQGLINFVGADKALEWFGFSGQIPQIDVSQYQFDEIANEAASRLAEAVKGRNSQLQEDLTTDYIGAMSTAIGDAATWAGTQLRSLAAGLGLDKDKKKKGGKTDAEKFDDIINGAERTIASLQAEAAALGMSELAAMKLRRETDLLNEAKQKNITLSKDQRDQLIAVAHGMAELEYQTKKNQEALEFSKDIVKGFFSDFRSGIEQGKSLWQSFGDAALNVLNKIADKLLNDVLDALFQVNSAAGSGGGKSGGIFGFLGNLFGFGGGGGFTAAEYAFTAGGMGLFAKGDAFGRGISGYSNSVVNTPSLFAFANGIGLMGEAGPEAIMPLKRGPDGSLGVVNHGGDGGGSGKTEIVYAPSYTVEAGATQEAVAELRKIQEEDRRNFRNNVNDALVDLRIHSADV